MCTTRNIKTKKLSSSDCFQSLYHRLTWPPWIFVCAIDSFISLKYIFKFFVIEYLQSSHNSNTLPLKNKCISLICLHWLGKNSKNILCHLSNIEKLLLMLFYGTNIPDGRCQCCCILYFHDNSIAVSQLFWWGSH